MADNKPAKEAPKAPSVKQVVRRLFDGGERGRAIDLAVSKKLSEKDWPDGMVDHIKRIETRR